mgnify:CR=1 FL=1
MLSCEKPIVIVPSLAFLNRYFVFRNNGQEIAFEIKNENLNSSAPLSSDERAYIYTNIGQFKTNSKFLLNLKRNLINVVNKK